MKNNRCQILPIRFPSLITAALAAACVLLCGSVARVQAGPVITNAYPNGAYQFQATNKLVFSVTSSANITNITLSLQTTPLGGATFLKVYSIGNGLTITGTSTSNNVSAPLSSNTVYSATVSVGDAGGNTASTNWAFDTITPGYTWESEDYNYTDTNTMTSGLYIENQIDAYLNRNATHGVDAFNPGGGNASYRPVDDAAGVNFGGLATEVTGDVPRLQYINAATNDYDVGWTDNGDWAKYTRHYPAGIWNIYMRAANPNGPGTDSASISVASGTAALNAGGTFAVPTTGGWQNYQLIPMKDSSGNLVQLTSDGTVSTLQAATDPSASYNVNYYLLMPANTNPPPIASIVFTNIYPDGVFQFEQTNRFSFTANSTTGIDPSSIIVQLSGVNLLGQISGPTILSGASGLTVTGSSTSYTVTFALATNTMYSVFIQALDLNGVPSTTTITFDTISSGYYTFEAEDWDFGGGQYVDNPQDGANAIDPTFPAANAYYLLDSVPEVDFHMVGGIAGFNAYAYRGEIGPPPTLTALNTEGANDKQRSQYTNSLPGADWDNGNTHSGDWGDYTRHYPAGVWNIYMRSADGGGTGGRGSIDVVTNGYGTANQQTSPAGTFAPAPATGNWQAYTWVPLLDTSGNLIKFDPSQYHHNPDGTVTLRYTSGGGYNANFFMFVPADTTLPTVANLYPNGLVQFQNTNTLAFTASSSLGIPTSTIQVTLNGVDVSTNLVFTGSSTSWNVSYPHLQNDTIYSVVISVQNTSGATYTQSYGFNTFKPNYYQWESVDWNYTDTNTAQAGLYFDNPQINDYFGKSYTVGIDVGQSNPNTLNNPFNYRPYTDGTKPDTSLLCPSQESAGATPRPQFIAAGQTDYKADYVENGTWMDYTRHYPAGTYYVYGTFTSGNSVVTTATLGKVTSSPTLPNQTVAPLGTFVIPISGWSTFAYTELTDASSNPVKVTFDGSLTTLQFGGNPTGDGNTCNTGFFMLVPVAPAGLTLSASISGGNIHISFPTQTGSNYQLLYKTHLSDASWTTLGSPVSGNNAVQSVSDTVGGSSRFYRVQIQ
jgi:Carbohydrate binding module (family 6)